MSQHSSRGTAWEALRKQVLQRDNYLCVYCGREATEVDHIVAKSVGGKDELSNLVSSCKEDNARKGASSLVRMNWFNQRWLDRL